MPQYMNPTEDYNAAYGDVANISKTQVDTDQYFSVAIESQLGPNTTAQAKDMFDPVFLGQFASDYYRQYAAIVAKNSLMEPAAIEVQGSATFMANRLVVRTWAAQWMAGLVVSCLILLAIALFTVPRRGILPRNPSNIPDMAALLLHSHGLRDRLCRLGAADEKDLTKALEKCHFHSGVVHSPMTNQREFVILDQQQGPDDWSRTFSQTPARRNQHPGVLHPAFRLTMCTILAGIIIALEMMLRKSNKEDGLGDVGNDTYMHYLWTTLPALSFGLITMAFSSMDFRIRSLAPYMMLKNRVTTDKFLQLDHLVGKSLRFFCAFPPKRPVPGQ